jgi:hypothetical protein
LRRQIDDLARRRDRVCYGIVDLLPVLGAATVLAVLEDFDVIA